MRRFAAKLVQEQAAETTITKQAKEGQMVERW
jgi:hypothetical protein